VNFPDEALLSMTFATFLLFARNSRRAREGKREGRDSISIKSTVTKRPR